MAIQGKKLRNHHFLENIYARRSRDTLQQWLITPENNGQQVGKSFYPQDLKALTSGIQPSLNPAIKSLLNDIRCLTAADPLAEVMSEENFHLTFLAITSARYPHARDMPPGANLIAIFNQTVENRELAVADLQLVALPDQLLLAGIPGEQAEKNRKMFWDALRASEWQTPLQQRYPGQDAPPEFWHTTLLRYKAEKLPPGVRDYFISHSNCRYGAVSGEIRLALATYNWGEVAFLL